MGEWLYYNLLLKGFTQRHCSRLYSIKVAFYLKNTHKSLFEPPFEGLRDNILSIVRWKARGRLPILRN